MSKSSQFEEKKVQEALDLSKQNPTWSLAECARITRMSYPRVWRRSKGILASNTRGGNNKKLLEPQNDALKDYLLMCHNLGKSAGIEEV